MKYVNANVFAITSLAASLTACAPVESIAQNFTGPDTRFAITDTADYDPVSLNATPSDPPTLKVDYGTASERQYGELRMPKGEGPFPVAVIYHGGCWAGMGGTANVAALASFLTENGVATWTPSYRELGSDGGWPNSFEDWANGLRHVRTLAEDYPLDLSRITLMGHSAGVTPVMWLAARGRGLKEGPRMPPADLPSLRGAVAIDGPLWIEEFVGIDAAICGGPVIASFMGGTPAELPQRYALLDPRSNPPMVERLIVVDGALPDPDPALLVAMTSQGVAVDVIRVSQDQHFNMLVPGTKDFAAIGPALLQIAGGQ